MKQLLHTVQDLLSNRSWGWSKFKAELKAELIEKLLWHCPVCGTKKKLEFHHVIPVSVDRSRERDRSNIRLLCKRHHLMLGHLENYNTYNLEIDTDIAWWSSRLHRGPRYNNWDLKNEVPPRILEKVL